MNSKFPENSRYHAIPIQEMTTETGQTIVYLSRRFIPAADQFQVISQHEVTQNDRLDLLAAQYLGDPEQFWQICDANNAVRPEDLETSGQWIRITLPAGLQGVRFA